MATVTLKGNPVNTSGELPNPGSKVPDFSLTKGNLSDVSLKDYSGKRIILNIFPSIDTATCAASVRKFNEQASKLNNTVVLCISADLPFASARFCGAEGIKNVETLSIFRNNEFATNYGVKILDGPLAGLLARSVVVVNEEGNVVYTELVSEIANEPNYSKALESLN
ncbi:MAG: thiol peroxidase [Leptospiraceae bacterium]|nr:thiol peroxidase [Leptospiraceae bacterium]